MQKSFLFFVLLLQYTVNAQTITTVAGGGSGGDGGPATAAQMSFCQQVTTDVFGNFYFAEFSNHRIRKVNALGVISTIAGTGSQGFSGDGGMATTALLKYPSGIASDSIGNIYICDQGNNRIRKINVLTGIITTVVGNGTPTFAGDGGLATAASLNNPFGIFVNRLGELYVSDKSNSRVRRVATSGIITTVAGNGTIGDSGDGGPATAAQISPTNVCFDRNGNMFISDEGNNKVRKVNTLGIISTVAGVTGSYFFNGDNIPATTAYISPIYIAVGIDDNIYIPDNINNRIRVIDPFGLIHTIAGDGTLAYGGDGGPATTAQIPRPSSIAFDTCGNMLISQIQNARIRKVTFNPAPCDYLGIEQKEQENIAVYPNPTTDELHIDGVTTSGEYVLLNVTGIIEQRGILEAGSNTIRINALPMGLHLLALIDEDGNRTVHKITKQ